MEIKLTTLECLKCGHKWIPRKPEPPLTCPKCRQAGWNRPKKNKNKIIERTLNV